MAYKDPEVGRQRNRDRIRAKREAARAPQRAWDAAHPEEVLLRDGELLIQRWVRRGEYLLRKMILNKAWYEANKERTLQEAKDKYANDPEHRQRVEARNKRYVETHQEAMQTYHKQWYEDHKEQQSVRASGYYLAHRDTIVARVDVWRRNNPEKRSGYSEQYRAKKAGAPLNDLTPAQWHEIKTMFRQCCAYCGKKPRHLTMDHIMPISRGGSHTASNIVPACRSCNAQKHAGPPKVPVQPLLFTVAPSKKKP